MQHHSRFIVGLVSSKGRFSVDFYIYIYLFFSTVFGSAEISVRPDSKPSVSVSNCDTPLDVHLAFGSSAIAQHHFLVLVAVCSGGKRSWIHNWQ